MPDSGGKFVSDFPAAVRPSIATRSRLEDRRDTLSAISLTNRLRAAEIDDGSGWRHVETDSKELTVPFSRFPESRVAGGTLTSHSQGVVAGSSLAPDTPKGRVLVPGWDSYPGFDVVVHYFDASAVVYTCSSSRRTPDPLIAGLLRSRFPPRLFTGMTLRRFGISACTANPEGLPPSLAQHGSCWRSSTSSSLPFRTHLSSKCRSR